MADVQQGGLSIEGPLVVEEYSAASDRVELRPIGDIQQ